MTVSIVNHKRLMELLQTTNTEDIMHYLPRWMTPERLYSLLHNYQHGALNDLEVAELDAVLEIVPALMAQFQQPA